MNRLIRDRQQLSDDVSHLQRSMRDTARQLAPTQPAASSKLREALGTMDESDLGNRVQRTADGLRRGINPNANGNEAAVASGLKQLGEGLKQAQAGMGSAPGAPDPRKQGRDLGAAALDQLDRLRSTVQSLSRGTGQPGSRGSQRGTQPGQSGQAQGNGSQQGSQPGSSVNQAGQTGSQVSRAGSQGQGSQGRSQASGGQSGQAGQGRGSQAGGQQPGGGSSGSDRRASLGGDSSSGDTNSGGNRVRNGGGGGAATWNVNTGNNNTYDRNARAPQPSGGLNPADSERTINQGMQELSRLRQLTHGDPTASREVDALVKEMQQLEPGRFPGNPEMVEQLHQQVLNDVDKLELELRRSANDPALAQIRTTKIAPVPQGYGDAVAEYYRRLGRGQ